MTARPLIARQPNERLLSLIREAGCSNAGLARRVNMCAAEHGLDFRYDKTSVARWIRGQQPRGRAPDVIAEALGRKLGRPVTVDEIGMGTARQLTSSVGLHFAADLGDCLEQAMELFHSDVVRRESGESQHPYATGGSHVAPAALVEPSRDWLITPPDAEVARTSGPRVGAADVAAVRATTAALVDLDRRWGAGHVRPVVVHYLNSVVAGLLAGSYQDTVGRELFGAAARLTELAGYMAVDSGLPGLAQRYYIQALRLAQAAGDRAFGGYVLAAGMSHLAAELGNPREVIQLARAAQEGSRGVATPRAGALFLAAEARGHAQLGDRESCRRAAAGALGALEGADAERDDDPPWVAHFDGAYLADELAHCHRDLGQGRAVQKRASEALAGHPEARARRRAIGLLLLATGQLQEGGVDEACHTAGEAGSLLSGLRSGRAEEYFADFRKRLEPHRNEPLVREFTERWQLQLEAAGG
ncbi:transcriptional regulator [Streptomyces litchfieldiae]|uniref:Transcriptional regulator n=1 Tax=Streptomyces litchfieldiae TaxID=3075543 RepID=A0ABU2MRG2_9ACTN|nr:transcriptional regulator [Streptomyces sp. DSM 44938]MDT0343179.1 transcriptional regulator [Streptomyces sp. DSM 44938]